MYIYRPIAAHFSFHWLLPYLYSSEVDDFDDNEYTVEFMDGTGFPLTGCVAIDTDEDFILEGDHAFTVNITGASPNDAVVINTLSSTHMVTIDDDESTYVIVAFLPDFISIHCVYEVWS